MKRFWIILCLFAVLLTGCAGGEETSRSEELSPGLEHLREEAILYRHTASHKDLSFSAEEFQTVPGRATWSLSSVDWESTHTVSGGKPSAAGTW